MRREFRQSCNFLYIYNGLMYDVLFVKSYAAFSMQKSVILIFVMRFVTCLKELFDFVILKRNSTRKSNCIGWLIY